MMLEILKRVSISLALCSAGAGTIAIADGLSAAGEGGRGEKHPSSSTSHNKTLYPVLLLYNRITKQLANFGFVWKVTSQIIDDVSSFGIPSISS